jgi:hypothetical protein
MSTDPLEPLKNHKDPSAHAVLMDYHAGQIKGALPDGGKQGQAVKWILDNGFSLDDAKACYDWVATWCETPNWAIVKSKIGGWATKDNRTSPNGNGHKPQVEIGPFGMEFIPKPFTAEDAIRLSPGKNPDDVRANFEGSLDWKDVRCL